MAGGVFSSAKLNGMTIRESADDGSDFTNPDADYRRLFLGEDGQLHVKDSSGTVTGIGGAADLGDLGDVTVTGSETDGQVLTSDGAGAFAFEDATGGGAVATDAIWDAAGDLAVGSGANTAAKLSLGAAGGALSRINGAVAWNSGTSFPTAAAGDRYWRTDLGMEFYYDGTRWLSTQLFSIQPMAYIAGANPGTSGGDLRTDMNATGDGGRVPVPPFLGGSNLWLVSHHITFNVKTGGSALGASHKWVCTLNGLDTNISSTGVVATTNIDSGSSAVFRQATTAIGAALAAGTLFFISTWTKTGTPGTLVTGEVLTYRVIG